MRRVTERPRVKQRELTKPWCSSGLVCEWGCATIRGMRRITLASASFALPLLALIVTDACVGDTPATPTTLDSGNNADTAAPSDVSVPVDAADAATGQAIEISTGVNHACALTATGAVYCWGSDENGAAGVDPKTASTCMSNNTSFACVTTPTRVANLPPMVHLARGLGDQLSCAYSQTDLYCWGANNHGQLGHTPGLGDVAQCGPSKIPCSFTPTKVPLTGAITSASAGFQFACAIAGGAVSCWGTNGNNQLGSAGATSEGTVYPVPGVPNPATVSVGLVGTVACAISGSDAYCWGANNFAQLGHAANTGGDITCNSTPCSSGPVKVPVGTSVDGVETSGFVQCAHATSNKLVCWGYNQFGNLGLGYSTGAPLAPITSLDPAFSVFSTRGLNCANTPRPDAGTGIACWGPNVFAQVGDGTTGTKLADGGMGNCAGGGPCVAFPEILSGSGVKQVSASPEFVVILRGVQMFGWGRNDLGELGHAPLTSGDSTCNGSVPCALNATPITLPP